MLLRIVNFVADSEHAPTGHRVGMLHQGRVADFAVVAAACASVQAECEAPSSWSSALSVATCEACLAAAQQYADWFEAQPDSVRENLSLARDQVRLLPPVLNPGKVFCLAQNFPSHVAESDQHITQSGQSVADAMTPHVFMKPSSTVCGDGDPIWVSRNTQFLDYEAEAAVIIGRRCKYVSPEEAVGCIAGVSACNDVSERKLKVWERQEEREWDRFFDWLNGKWMDNSLPLGPALVPAASVNLDDLNLRCLVNGELRQTGNTGEMFHNAARTVSYISQILTLEPGDVIALGTPGGVGAGSGRKLMPGDVVTVEIEGLMALTNPVVTE